MDVNPRTYNLFPCGIVAAGVSPSGLQLLALVAVVAFFSGTGVFQSLIAGQDARATAGKMPPATTLPGVDSLTALGETWLANS